MRIAEGAISFLVVARVIWHADWAWGLPSIILTVLIHALGLGLINQKAVRISSGIMQRRHPKALFVVVMSGTTLLATSLHAVEAGIWAAAYRLLGALPDSKSAMLYSLGAIASYGHAIPLPGFLLIDTPRI